MTTEEKAKAYDEAMRITKEMYQNKDTDIAVKNYLTSIFPELAESEDERIWKGLKGLVKNAYECGRVNCDKKMYDTFIAYLEKQKEQKPAEWSEWDEIMIQNILGSYKAFEETLDLTRETDRDILESLNFEREWLKSLRPQPHWKPTQEQIETLQRWLLDTEFNGGSRYVYPIFESLYNDLKEL